ncbi:MAG: CPBP family intramembrane metalloprotease [Chloroflexi bacterium]|nr:CPBP family intramembrane metalloprotease [Chloroflexota bacterium]
MTRNISRLSTRTEEQYSLGKILSIWALAAIPMGIIGWVITPALSVGKDPLAAASTRIWALTVGLIWQFILTMIIVRREEGDLRWAAIQRRLWLNAPLDPKTGEAQPKLWWWVVPGIVLFAISGIVLSPILGSIWTSIFPFFAEPPSFAFGSILESPEIQAQLVGNWSFVIMMVLLSVFNTFLGEELLFRGVLLPKMNGIFGKWDWVANGLLFTLYHIHQPWGFLSGLLESIFFFALPVKRFRSTWMAIIIHSGQNIFFLFLILGLVLGLA